jgi:hypothetical protein
LSVLSPVDLLVVSHHPKRMASFRSLKSLPAGGRDGEIAEGGAYVPVTLGIVVVLLWMYPPLSMRDRSPRSV